MTNELKEIINQYGLTQLEAARTMGVSRVMLSNYLAGRWPVPEARMNALRYWASQQGHLMTTLERLPPPWVATLTVAPAKKSWEVILYNGTESQVITSNSPRLLAEEIEAATGG